MAHYIQKSCIKCGACLYECPTGSIIEGKDHYLIDVDTCADHAACLTVCPVEGAILSTRPPSSAPGTPPVPEKGKK